MTIVNGLILTCWLLIIPLCMGMIPAAFVDKQRYRISFMWTTGYIYMWALFQIICVPFIFSKSQNQNFLKVVTIFGIAASALAVLGVFVWILRGRKSQRTPQIRRLTKKELFLWSVALGLILLQLICSVTMRYADGDDAFYVAVSTLTNQSNSMYQIMPYSVGGTGISLRHGLAPFPIWIAFLARVSGGNVTIVAHVVVATVLIAMTYVIYYEISKTLFGERKENIPIFLSFTALLVLYGDYSIYTAENFMIARSRQGKAALGNIIIPVVILLFLLIFERMREEKKVECMLWVSLAATVTAACLCSTLGTFLMCLFLGVIGVCAGVVYRKWGLVWRTACCCLPALVFVALYFRLG